MDNKIKILQIGINSWESLFTHHHASRLEWTFWNLKEKDEEGQGKLLKKMKGQTFDAVVCTDYFDEGALKPFFGVIEAYRLFLSQDFESSVSAFLKASKCPIFMDFNAPTQILDLLCSSFYSDSRVSGLKLDFARARIAPQFSGNIVYQGAYCLSLEGDFSSLTNEALLSWNTSIIGYRYVLEENLKLWLEYEHSSNVELSLTLLELGAQGEIIRTHHYSETEIESGPVILYDPQVLDVSLSLFVKGEGKLNVGALHYRKDRQSYGELSVGGKRIVDAKREELFYYFHPGNLKPPLNVYFSGYKNEEAFQGFRMMKNLGQPFILVTDTRLKGGSFYLGSEELEKKMIEVIQEHLDMLQFTSQELILSGMSMGCFAALYYASFLSPHAVVGTLPLTNLGDIARNGKLVRPEEFETSFDIVGGLMGEFSQEAISRLNDRFWEVFSQNDFYETKFIFAHMLQDDFDNQAYPYLLESLSTKRASLIGKGFAGRHNDDHTGVRHWFQGQYKRLIKEDFRGDGDHAL